MGALVLLVSLVAAQNKELSAAIERYESARFAVARDRLLDLVDDPSLSREEAASVRTYLAACYLALKDRNSARVWLRGLAREQPDARPSPALFGPDLIALADEAWADEAKRRPSEPPPPPPVAVTPVPFAELPTPAVVVPKPQPENPPSRLLASLPLGIGHFARGQPVQGAVWLAAEAGLFLTALATVLKLESLKDPGYPRSVLGYGWYREEVTSTADVLNAVATAAFFTGVGVVALNVLIAYLTVPEP